MTNIQEMLDQISKKKFANCKGHEHHYWNEKLTEWRHSEENRIKNQNQFRKDQRLSPTIADEIRRLHWEDNLSIKELSDKYSVSNTTIKKVVLNERFYNPNSKYVGIKFRSKTGNKKGSISSKRKMIRVFDENMNFIQECSGTDLCKSMGFNLGYINTFLRNTKTNYHKKSKKYFFGKD
jgi:hypothetical protein